MRERRREIKEATEGGREMNRVTEGGREMNRVTEGGREIVTADLRRHSPSSLVYE